MDHALLAAGEFGSYINGLKILPVVIVSVVWLRLMTWVDKDSQDARMPREIVNGINLGGWAIAMAVMLMPLSFIAAFGI
ncbi:MAG: hypothetical protein H7144_08495, partial [Burkholderiales bacterium]|nr:hypothetical protein [Phycisphaerae bacterium]